MREHRIWPNASEEDALSVLGELDTVLKRRHPGSGLDWGALARRVVEHWADRLVQLHELLSNVTSTFGDGIDSELNITQALFAVRASTYSPINPYMDTGPASSVSARDMFFSLIPQMSVNMPSGHEGERSHLKDMQRPFPHSRLLLRQHDNMTALQRCMGSFTRFLDRNPHIHKTPQEELLQTSVERVLQRLCTDFGTIFAQSMDADDAISGADAAILFIRWNARIAALKEWLDWTEWLRCDAVCPRDVSASFFLYSWCLSGVLQSVCVMAMWPFTLWEWDDGPKVGDLEPRCMSVLPRQPRWPDAADFAG